MVKKLILSVFLFPLISAAGESLRTGEALKTELSGSSFRGTLKEGFHFNESAPNTVTIDGKTIKPAKLKGREAEFTNLPEKFTTGRASLYSCDDAVTFCEPRFIALKGGIEPSTAAPVAGSEAKTKGPNKHGFIEDDFQQALATAKAQNKLVLIDFAARWCPGCVRYETETFNTKTFKDLTKDFVKLKIDVDKFESIVLSEKFAIKGIPSLVVVTADQEEIDRIVDYQPFSILAPFFASVRADPTPLSQLLGTAKPDDNAMNLRLGKRLLSVGRYPESVVFLSRVRPTPPELWFAKIGAAEARHEADPTTKPQYVQTLKEAIASEPGSSRSIGWRVALVGLLDDKAEIAKIRRDGVAAANAMLKSNAKLKEETKTELVGEFTGYERMLVAMNKADLVETSQASPEEISKAWKEAADVGRGLKIPVSATGNSMRFLIILTKAEQYKEADALAVALMKRDPGNPELERRRLRALLGLKKFNEAIELGRKVIKASYGRNEYWVAEVLAKAYIGADRKPEARALLDEYLSRSETAWSSVKGSRKSMEDLRTSL